MTDSSSVQDAPTTNRTQLSRTETEILARSEVFAGFSVEKIQSIISAIGENQEVVDGTDVVVEGDQPDAFFILLQGAVDVIRKTESGRELTIAHLSAVQTIGDFAFFDPAPRSATLRAVGPCRLIRIPFAHMEAAGASATADHIRANMVTGLVRDIRNINQSATHWLEEKLVEAQKRVALGQFTVSLISVVGFYMFLMSEVTNRVAFGPWYSLILNVLLLALCGVVAAFIRKGPYPRATFGVTLVGARRAAGEAVVMTLPLLGAFVLIKALLIASVPRYSNVPLFDFGSSWQKNLTLFALIEIGYSLLVPAQEFITRSGLQVPFELFLDGPYRRWAAILVSNVLFSATHLHFGLRFAIAVFPLGVFWGWMFSRQKTLIGVCVSHLLVGNFTFAVLGVHDMLQ